MPQLFPPVANTVFRVGIVLLLAGVTGSGAFAYLWSRSDAAWNVGHPAPQPIPFRHDLHAGTLGLGCGYCHTFAERAADAGMPSARTCMTCHSEVWVGASVLEPLRTSLALDRPLAWTSVHRLPDYAYFHHGAHVGNGVACETCHGDVRRMPKTVKVHTLSMGWCLDCHRDPLKALAPSEAADLVGPPPGASRHVQPSAAGSLVGLEDAARRRLTDCNTCHR